MSNANKENLINSNESTQIPRKKNLVLETAKNVLVSAGIVAIFEFLSGTNFKSSWKFKGKDILPAIIPEAIVSAAIVTFSLAKDISHNQEVDRLTKQQVDSFAKRIEQEQEKKEATLASPTAARSI
ncbi:MAG: hypothetical protein M3Y81_03560 [Chloroflexota bacterium]|nr:hypothetical protein [Chloroflexota bacterium]